jgi:hypothetical protein
MRSSIWLTIGSTARCICAGCSASTRVWPSRSRSTAFCASRPNGPRKPGTLDQCFPIRQAVGIRAGAAEPAPAGFCLRWAQQAPAGRQRCGDAVVGGCSAGLPDAAALSRRTRRRWRCRATRSHRQARRRAVGRTKRQHAQQRHLETGTRIRRQRQIASTGGGDLVVQLHVFGVMRSARRHQCAVVITAFFRR